MFPDAIRRADLLARYRPMMESLDAVLATYVWLDACEGVRSKTKTLSFEPQSLQQVPQWANAADWFYGPELPLTTEMRMIPVRLYADPLLGGHHKLILCELVTFDEGTPIKCNRRAQLTETAQRAIVQESQFRFQQEYYLFEGKNRFHPLGWPEEGGLPAETGPAAVGANAIVGRDLAEAHYRACLAAGVNIAGASAANGLAKWTFEVGPGDALAVSDDLWMARYLLHRLSEQFDVVVSLDSGLFPGSVSGSSFSFNTKTMRSPLGGLQAANEALEKARNSDDAYQGKLSFAGYPSDLKRRIQKGSSVVTFDVTIKEDADGNGFALLDRRPPSNLNPYVLCEEIIRSICL